MFTQELAAKTVFALLLSLGFGSQLFAFEPPLNSSNQPEKVTLQWKFVKGQTAYYTHEQETTHKEVAAGEVREIINRLLYRYRWQMVFEMEPDIVGIGVTFQRVRHESVTPQRTITTDTYSPLSPESLSSEAKSQQEEVYRILQTKFMFLATPSRGDSWPEDLYTDQPVPSDLRTPPSTPFFSPENFTSGDSLSMPPGEVRIGDSWTTQISAGRGVGRYRLLGRANRLGHDCWQIEGTTTYNSQGRSGDGVNHTVGPRISMHFFDTEIGRLVLSEEVTPIRSVLADGRIVETTIRTKRKLEQPPSDAVVRMVTRDLADGETRKFVYRDGSPANVRNDWLGVLHTGISVKGILQL